MRLDLADLDEVSKAAHSPDVTDSDVVIFLAALASPTTLEAIDPAELVTRVRQFIGQ